MEDSRFMGRSLPERRMFNAETLTDSSLRVFDFAVNPVRWEIDEAHGDLGEQCFKLQLLTELRRQCQSALLCGDIYHSQGMASCGFIVGLTSLRIQRATRARNCPNSPGKVRMGTPGT